MLFLKGSQLKIVLLLLLFLLFPACLSRRTTPALEKDIHNRSTFKVSSNPLELLLRHLRLTKTDLIISTDTTTADPFRLDKVNSFLRNPLKIEPYATQLTKDLQDGMFEIETITQLALRELEFDVKTYTIPESVIKENSTTVKQLFPKLEKKARNELLHFFCSARYGQKKMNKAFESLAQNEIGYLGNYFSEMILMDKILNTVSPDALGGTPVKPLKKEEQYVRERAFHLASTIDLMQLYEGSLVIAAAIDKLLMNIDSIANSNFPQPPSIPEGIRGDIIFSYDTPLGKIIIGGKGTTYYTNIRALLILDLGGDDEYHNITASPSFNPFTTFSTVIIDMNGNDLYTGDEGYAQGSGVFGFNCLIDQAGNDTYLSHDFSQGSGLFGVGILYDSKGNDRYRSDVFGQGSGSFGCGLLCDLDGNDSYYANLYSQGFGFVGGAGFLIDAAGNDTFFVGDTYPDYREPEFGFDSFSQGCGLGDRYFASGGIGLLWDQKGNDSYRGNYFSQGSSYWFALGLLLDGGGNDTYKARRYSQGTGTHHTIGALLDTNGNDRYVSWGVSQGCGYDFSQGLLFDGDGNDIYRADWFSQGTSGISGIGIMLDQSGDDLYVAGPFNSQGSGQYNDETREGSIGLLLDLSGNDRYSGKGENDLLWKQGCYGGGIDLGNGIWNRLPPSSSSTTITFKQNWNNIIKQPPFFLKEPPLSELETDFSDNTYRQQVIVELSARGPAIIQQLVDYLAIKDTQLTSLVREILKEMGSVAAPHLRKILKQKNLDRARTGFLLSVLADIRDEESSSTFISFIDNDDPQLRTLAIKGLIALKHPDLPELLLSATQDESRSVRKYAALALKESDDPSALKALTDLLRDEHFSVRFAAFEGLQKKEEKAKPFLTESISANNGYPLYAVDLVEDLLKKWGDKE
jgi:hypothetical protein